MPDVKKQMFYSGTPDPILFSSTEASELNPEDKKNKTKKQKWCIEGVCLSSI